MTGLTALYGAASMVAEKASATITEVINSKDTTVSDNASELPADGSTEGKTDPTSQNYASDPHANVFTSAMNEESEDVN